MLSPCFTVVPIPEDSGGDSSDVVTVFLQLCRFLKTLVETALMLWQLLAVFVELLALSSSLSSSLSSGRNVVRI